jgi:hypothetical protein
MRVNHFRCDICANNNTTRWFISCNSLQTHLEAEHFACDDPRCVAEGMVAFETRFELHLHRIRVHGASGPIPLDLDGPKAEADPTEDRSNRLYKARRHLRSLIRDRRVGNRLFSLIDALETGKVSAAEFVSELSRQNLDSLFCDVAAAIRVVSVRAEIVREKMGLRHAEVIDEQPVVDSSVVPPPPAAPPAPPVRGRKARAKRIVLTSF